MILSDFDDIRPYSPDEIPAAMQRIAQSESFPLLASYVFPGEPLEQVRQRVASYQTTGEFQRDAMFTAVRRIIENSITELTVDGLEQLSPEAHYLFVSNHRDIMLDASLLQYELVRKGFDTTEITFGANLMMNPLIVDVGKSNKMFKVERPGPHMRDFYKSSLHLSEYLRYVITRKGQSVWIAQRNGRTKDGWDATDQGIIKMFCMSERRDPLKAIADLHIVPVAISYEWESCDILKTLELYASRRGPYVKKPGEDLRSILTGILQPKGRVHLAVTPPVTAADLRGMEHLAPTDYHKMVARLIDRRINGAYRLYANNYIAHDLRAGTPRYADRYTEEQYHAFVNRMSELNGYEGTDPAELRALFLDLYAHPVDQSSAP